MVDYRDIENLNEHESRELLIKELGELDEGFAHVMAERKRIRDELGSIENIDNLLVKIDNLDQVLYHTEGLINTLARGKYYGAQLQDIPTEVVDLRRLHNLFLKLRRAVQKLKKHLVNDSAILDEYEGFIRRSKQDIERYSGMKRYRFIFSYFSPTSYLKRNRDRLGSKRIASNYKGRLYMVRSFAFRFKNQIQLNGDDIELLINSIKLAHAIGSHLQNNISIWRRNVSHGQFSADYTQELDQAFRYLMGLIGYLEELADDERFIRTTNIQILKIERNEEVTIDEMRKLMPGSE